MRPIDADELKKSMDCDGAVKYGNDGVEQTERSYSTLMRYEIADYIDDEPTLELEPVRHGQWVNPRIIVGGFAEEWGVDCSYCGEMHRGNRTPYCPNCGARMDGRAKHERATE